MLHVLFVVKLLSYLLMDRAGSAEDKNVDMLIFPSLPSSFLRVWGEDVFGWQLGIAL